MARTFADLSRYEQELAARPNSDFLGNFLQGVQLPQKMAENQLAQQLQNAINLQKLRDLQNPQAALLRRLEEELTIKGALNPDLGITRAQPGLVGQTIYNPGAITPAQQAALPSSDLLALRQTALDQGGVTSPAMAIPTAPAAGLPETPISAFGIQTGLTSNPNIPRQEEQRKLDRDIQLANLRIQSQYDLLNNRQGFTGNQNDLNRQNAQALADLKNTQANFALQSKIDAAQALSDSRGAQAKELQEDKQKFTAEQNDKNLANRLAVADKRAKIGAGVSVASDAYQAEGQQRILNSVDDLEKDVGYDTVGFADWFKGVPTTEAKSFASRLKTLKAAIAFGELNSMRAASKTGGALGQVSNIELGLLESSLGSLDQAQSPSDFREELGKIRDSIKRWRAASGQASAAPAGGSASTASTLPKIIKITPRAQ